jgi:hypothetical protein
LVVVPVGLGVVALAVFFLGLFGLPHGRAQR